MSHCIAGAGASGEHWEGGVYIHKFMSCPSFLSNEIQFAQKRNLSGRA